MNKMSSQEILYKLIAFDTVSSNSNMEMIHFILDYLEKFGVSARLVRDLHEDKANLFAVIVLKIFPALCCLAILTWCLLKDKNGHQDLLK